MTPPEQMRAAAARVACGHRFPVQPPEGDLYAPGDCSRCGLPWERRHIIADELRRPLEAWLLSAAEDSELIGTDTKALALARVITGETS